MIDWMPNCPIHALTGLLCPGCGGTRAVFSLLSGDWAAAFRFNPLVTLMAPAALMWLAACGLRRRWLWHQHVTNLLLGAAAFIAIARNL